MKSSTYPLLERKKKTSVRTLAHFIIINEISKPPPGQTFSGISKISDIRIYGIRQIPVIEIDEGKIDIT